MKKILEQLFEHKQLSYETAKETLTNIGQGKYNQSQIAAFLTVLPNAQHLLKRTGWFP